MEVVDVPSHFTCPISLQIMRDPVTLCTGITYDRESIEQWLFDAKKTTCPATKQELTNTELTPNHTLRRMMQHWCAANSSHGVERIPTPRAPVDKAYVARLLVDAAKPQSQMDSLRKLRALVVESERNRRCAEEAGVADLLLSVIKNNDSTALKPIGDRHELHRINYIQRQSGEESTTVCDETLSIFHHLKISEQGLRQLMIKNDNLIDIFTMMLRQAANYQSRIYALFLLKSVFEAISPARLVTVDDNLFIEIVRILRDQVSYKATKVALRILRELSPWGRNGIRFARAGAVPALIELLLDASQNKLCEMLLVVLGQLCGCAEGRQELLGHAAGVAVVSEGLVGISQLASEKAVRILHSLSKFSATKGFLQEMLKVGAVSKLCFVLQVGDCGMKTREKVVEILRMHDRTWKNSSCIPLPLHASYPSS